jgi:membrane protease YdiL (CAAX protease family)
VPAASSNEPRSIESVSPRRAVAEVVAAFAFATAVAAALYRVRALEGWFHVVVAALFLYLPAWLARGRDLGEFGFTSRPLARNLVVVGVAVAVVFPLFAVGFAGWQAIACRLPSLIALAPGPCPAARTAAAALASLLRHAAPRLPSGVLKLAATEVLGVALPEELFFRGWMQGRLAEAFPARARLLGAPVGGALVVAAALFALCHWAVQGNPATLAVFFPGLVFGWMRARTNSIFPGTLFHALCNLYIETLHRSLFG